MPRLPSNWNSSLPPLEPVADMPVNARCWCGSGKKWKHCHRVRDQLTPLNHHEVEDTLQKIRKKGFCSHPKRLGDDCSGKITDAHTVQRRGGLGAIAEDGHVLTVLPSMLDLIKHDGLPPPKRIGVGGASVFPGFCNKHDTQLFKAIEGKDITLDTQAAIRFSYRAVAFERFRKLAYLECIETMKQLDRGKPFAEQAGIQQTIHASEKGTLRGLRDIEIWKSQYDASILSGRAEGFHHWFVRFDRLLPIVGCGAFYPEFDFNGLELQRLGRMNNVLEHVALNVTSYDSQTIGCLGWFGPTDGPTAKLVNSMKALPEDRMADAFVRLAFEHSENIYLRQSWWDGLDRRKRDALRSHILGGGIVMGRTPQCLVDRGILYVQAGITETSSA